MTRSHRQVGWLLALHMVRLGLMEPSSTVDIEQHGGTHRIHLDEVHARVYGRLVTRQRLLRQYAGRTPAILQSVCGIGRFVGCSLELSIAAAQAVATEEVTGTSDRA